MASIRPITVYGEPVLHRRAAEVEVIDDEIRELIEDMYVTQDAAHGVGLAASQVGVGLRI
ncbi:peptide deformylase, partial [Xanthomonas citri pv. citri]|nr:peptide deformylase [Xanthomonas citri pv. citri]